MFDGRTDFDSGSYANVIFTCLLAPSSLLRMSEAALEVSQCHGLESMVENAA